MNFANRVWVHGFYDFQALAKNKILLPNLSISVISAANAGAFLSTSQSWERLIPVVPVAHDVVFLPRQRYPDKAMVLLLSHGFDRRNGNDLRVHI